MGKTQKCSLCGKETDINELQMLYSMTLSVKLMAMQTLVGEKPDPLPELTCCKKRGISSSALFCPVCRKILDAEALEDGE